MFWRSEKNLSSACKLYYVELKCINFVSEVQSFYNECHGTEQFCCYVASICNMCELKKPTCIE